jgi:hypothetical protein
MDASDEVCHQPPPPNVANMSDRGVTTDDIQDVDLEVVLDGDYLLNLIGADDGTDGDDGAPATGLMRALDEYPLLSGGDSATNDAIMLKIKDASIKGMDSSSPGESPRTRDADGQNAVDFACHEERLEDVILEEGYASDDSVDLSDDWTYRSPEWTAARRDLMIALDTFDQTRKAIEQEKTRGHQNQLKLVEAVKQGQFYYKQFKAMKLSGIGLEADYKKAKEEFLSAIADLKDTSEGNERFRRQAEALEAALSTNLLAKERKFHELKSAQVFRSLNSFKTEVQLLRRAAYEKNRSVRRSKKVAMGITEPDEAITMWDTVISEARAAHVAWQNTMQALERGLTFVPEDEQDWWGRASQSVKHSLYGEMVAVRWYIAMKAECRAKVNEGHIRSSTEESLYSSWQLALLTVTETVNAWHDVCEILRQCINDIEDIFEEWWLEKLNSSVQAEAYWSDLRETMNDYIIVRFPTEATVVSAHSEESSNFDVRVTDDISSSSSFVHQAAIKRAASGGSVGSGSCASSITMSAALENSVNRLSSIKSVYGSLSTVDFDDWLESEPRLRRSTVPMSADACRRMQQVSDSMAEASAERCRIRSVHASLMSDDMNSRQELLSHSCFHEADVARAELLQMYMTHKRVSIIILGKLASVVSLDNAASKKYADLVLCEALEDSHMDAVEARLRRDDWQRRIAVDSIVVLETRALRNQAALGNDLVEKIRTRRNHLRAKSVLRADEKAFTAAWGIAKR